MKKKTTTQYNIGDILTFEEVFNNNMTAISEEEYKQKTKTANDKYQAFLDVEEWRKHISWKKIKNEIVAVKLEDNKYEIREISQFSNNIKDIIHCQTNLDALFKYHPLLNTFKFNECTHKNEFNGVRYDEDTTPSEIFNFFKRNFGEWCPRQDIKETIQESLNNNRYNPLIDYFNNIVWDGIPRLETFLIDYYGAEDTKLNRVYFKRWMIALIKRTIQPGAKFDSMLILAGEQGKKKTTLFNWLGTINNVTYYNEAPNNLKDINTLIYASLGKMILTFDDFDDICNKGELGNVKSFITVQNRTAALKWQHEKTFPVTYVLAATTNQYNILVDDATFDERRFWIVKVNPNTDKFDIPDEVKDQLYAEAYYLYKQDPNQYLWIWENELKNEEIELQKEYKKANDDITVEALIDIFSKKYPINNGMFENEEQFRRYVDTYNMSENDKLFFEDTSKLEHIKMVPASWIIRYIKETPRSTDRIIQILHTQGFKVKKKVRQYIYDKQLTAIYVQAVPSQYK